MLKVPGCAGTQHTPNREAPARIFPEPQVGLYRDELQTKID
jgi:hypothetical protein